VAGRLDAPPSAPPAIPLTSRVGSYDGRVRSRDTSPEAHRVQIEAYRRMTPSRKVEVAVELSEAVMTMAADGIRSRHPDYDDEAVAWAVRRLRLGDDRLFARVWPGAPLLAI
jgi:hypothetical protein